MWKSYLTVAFRTLRRDRTYAAVNVLGLAAGIAVCLIVGVAVRHALSYDRFHDNADRIYRVVQDEMPLLDFGTTRMPPGLARSLEEHLHGIERAVALFTVGRSLISTGDRQMYVDRLFTTDEEFFRTFSFRLLRGDSSAVLTGPGRVVVTESLAARLFGDEDPLGRTLRVENSSSNAEYQVSGVVADPPGNSHVQFDALLSLTETNRGVRNAQAIAWNGYAYLLYVLFQEDVSPETAQAAMNSYGSAVRPDLSLEPLTRIHLYADPRLSGDVAVKSDVRYLYVLSGIALLTLLIACVSYVNLSIAGGTRRAREIGIRKVLGAGRAQVARQHLVEAGLTILIAMSMALGAVRLALPHVGRILGEELPLSYLGDSATFVVLLGILLLVGLAAGGYPAFVLSGLRPTRALYGGETLVGRNRRSFRSALIGFQFAVTIVLIASALVMHDQLQHIQDQRLGTEEQILILRGDDVNDDDAALFKRQLATQAHVVSVATGLPPGIDGGGFDQTNLAEDETVWMKRIRGDADYISTLGLQLIAGENFSEDGPDDQGYIINETAARIFDISDEDVGRRLPLGSWDDHLIRGIVADYHHRTLHDSIEPLYMFRTTADSPNRGFFLVRLHAESISQGLADVEDVWNRFIPDRPFDYSFLDDRIAAQYAAEQRLVNVFGTFAVLAIMLACLGLFGLGAYTIEGRMKEMSIRKIMGASAQRIFLLLSRDLLTPGFAASIVAIPIAYVAMHSWLEGFAYRIEVSAGTLLVAMSTSVLVAWMAASFHAVKVARINPAETLRHD